MSEIRRFFTDLRRRLQRFDDHVVTSDPQRAIAGIIVAAVVVFVPLFSAFQVARAADSPGGAIVDPSSEESAVGQRILSVRRIAGTAAIESRAARVRTKLGELARRLPGQSCLMATINGRTLASVAGNVPLPPASNMKLLVAAAALEVLGPDHRFETRLAGTRFGSTIAGNLWLVGGGDPLLSTRAYPPTQKFTTVSPTYLDALADEIAASGVRLVSGSVIGDESRYDDERFVPTWGDGIRAIEAGPLSALLVDDGTIFGEPLKSANPAVAAATVLTRLLEARGVRVLGTPASGVTPTDAPVLARLASAPFAASLVDLLSNSDNNAAELLLKEIGLVRLKQPTRIAGLQVMADVLTASGVSMDGVVLADGSGLDAGNRVTCTTLVSLLRIHGPASPIGQALALAGTTGTLQNVLTTGPANGRLRAKTGTLRNVKSLSGFFPVGDGAITFALVLSSPGVSNQSAYRPVWDDLIASFATYRTEPSAEQLLPG